MALVTVNGVPLPDPSSYGATTSTFVDSGRNVNGRVVGSVIRSGVPKIELKWNYLTAAQWANVVSIFDASFKSNITFFNQSTGNYDNKTLYHGDLTAELHNFDANGNITGWKNCSVSLIES